jgi:carotenoid cleavage dioxygenase
MSSPPAAYPAKPCSSQPTTSRAAPGWLLTYVYDAGAGSSDLVVLDAQNVAAPPVATVHLPQRVPAGFHGNWLPAA